MGGSPPAWSAQPVGKPSSYSRLVATYLAVDVGGTKLAVGLVDDQGRVLERDGRPTDRSDPWPDLEALVTAVLGRTGADRPVAVGVGCGGPMRDGGDLVSPLNIPGWRDFPLRPRMAALTGLPV